MINSIANLNTNLYNNYNDYNQSYNNKSNISNDENSSQKISQVGKKECQTCKNRKYVDGSDEANVSYKTPTHINASASASAVASHEYEHVANAVKEGNKKGNKLLSVSVTLKTAVCPECGRVYTAGGETKTTMKKSNDEENNQSSNDDSANPYEAGPNLVRRFLQQGQNINLAV